MSSIFEQQAVARARKIRVLIFDVDGVLTDGQIYVIPGPDGKGIEMKGFAAHDGLGISLARLGGLRVGIITKRNSQTVAIRAHDLKLEFVYQGQSHKLKAAQETCEKAGITFEEMAYVGDDVIDLPVMRECGLAIATANAATSQADGTLHHAQCRRLWGRARCHRLYSCGAGNARTYHQ